MDVQSLQVQSARRSRDGSNSGISCEKECSAGVGRDEKRSGMMWVPTPVQLADGLTKSSAGVFLRKALTSGTAQLHEESTDVLRRKQPHQQFERSSGRLSGANGS